MEENLNKLSSSMNRRLERHRNKVLELASKGNNQSEISKILQISQPTVNRDLSYLRRQARNKMKHYIDQKLPDEYEKCLIGFTSILKEAWNTATITQDKREKIQALSLAKECYSMKLELLTNATVVDDVIKFVSNKSEEKIKSASGEDNKEELNEPDYSEDKDQLEEKQQDEQTGGMTVNQVF